jgi:hypothetical protein
VVCSSDRDEIDVTTVTGNDRVWRQFTFAAITTTQIRAVVTQALTGYSRITEVEAWTP